MSHEMWTVSIMQYFLMRGFCCCFHLVTDRSTGLFSICLLCTGLSSKQMLFPTCHSHQSNMQQMSEKVAFVPTILLNLWTYFHYKLFFPSGNYCFHKTALLHIRILEKHPTSVQTLLHSLKAQPNKRSVLNVIVPFFPHV